MAEPRAAWDRYRAGARCWCGHPYLVHDWPGDACAVRDCECRVFRLRTGRVAA